MADNYLEKQYEAYGNRKAAWEKERKYKKKYLTPKHPETPKETPKSSMKIHHIAIWTFRLEELRDFYIRYFNGKSNEKYVNVQKEFESYFISFDEGPALELMKRTDVQRVPIEENRLGLTHLAFAFPSKEDVLALTEQLRTDGYTIAGEPRTSGDGYFESVILDPDGNRVECVYK